MMNSLIEFFSFQDTIVINVVLGTIILGVSSGMVGSFMFLRKRSLIGDAIAHAVLPGVCLAFLIYESKNPIVLLTGAMITGWLSIQLVDLISARSKIKSDTAIALVLSVFFGAGMLLLTVIKQSGNAAQAGIDHFLFGQAASLVGSDVVVFGLIGLIVVVTILLFYKPFQLIVFDREYAVTLGLNVRFYEFVLSTLTVLTVCIGIQAVGVVLMSALLIAPAAAARFWTNKLSVLMLLAVSFATLSSITGSYVSYVVPKMPTGPWIVVTAFVIAMVSILIAPKRGMLARSYRLAANRKKILRENVLKAFYHIGEREGDFYAEYGIDKVQKARHIPIGQLKSSLASLVRRGWLNNINDSWMLTEAGLNKAKRLIKLHRLWELYLTQYLRIAPDHVHDDAEAIEHIITPELERELEHLLGYPQVDPHQKVIPYQKPGS